MHCFIYKSLIRLDLYLYVCRENDFTSVPASLLKSIGKPELVMSLELTSERKLASADVNQVMKQLQDCGFYLQIPPIPVAIPERLQ